jgi:hypothetical protein
MLHARRLFAVAVKANGRGGFSEAGLYNDPCFDDP